MATTQRKRRKFDAPPLLEAVFELFAGSEARVAWTPASFQQLSGRFSEYSAREERLTDVGIQLRANPDGTIVHVPQVPQVRMRYWDASGHRAVQFGAGMAAHNVLKDVYGHFEDHLETIRRVFRAYVEVARPSALERLGQRYINLVRVPASELSVADYFEIYPKLPDGLAGGHRPLSVQVHTRDFKSGAVQVGLSLRSVDEKKGEALYVVDVYARSTSPVPVDADALVNWQVAAHDAVAESFDLAVSEKARRELFQETP
jgi:uncharacterized protein (TIGR04255 family)